MQCVAAKGLAAASIVFLFAAPGLANPPVPEAPSSHTAFIEQLNASHEDDRKRIVSSYDERLARFPDDYSTAIERCKFILESTPTIDDEDEPAEESQDPIGLTDCAKALDDRHGTHPEVVLYRLSLLWGEEAVSYASTKLADAKIAWTEPQRSMALGIMAEQRHVTGHLKEASEFAIRAASSDLSYDPTYFVADYLRSVHRTAEAIGALSDRIADDSDVTRLIKKARLALDLEAGAVAQNALDRASTIGQTPIDPILQARVLELNGETEKARALYAKQTEHWNRSEVLTRLFQIDVTRSDAASIASYEALRDTGWRADPFARYRLALAVHHPSAPWALRDVAGLLALFAMFMFCAFLPGAFVLPVHYAGLIRRARGAPHVKGRWGLRHVWLAGALLMVCGLFAEYVFAYPELAAIVDEQINPRHTAIDLSRAGILQWTLLSVCTVAAFVRRRDLTDVRPSEWLPKGTVGRALAYLLLVLMVGYANNIVIHSFDAPVTEGLTLSTFNVLRSIKVSYGTLVVLLYAVAIVPITEEFVFRGVMLEGLTRHVPFGWANALQALVFASMHDDFSRAPTIAAIGFLAGSLRRRTGSLATGVVLHGTNNLLASLSFAFGG